jgi:Protein of unknown function (DUF3631)
MVFSTWGFKTISGIGKRAATIEDRSIVISLNRKAKGEKIARLRHAPKADLADVASKLARVAKDQMAAFSLARPGLPEALNDRAQDHWEHLFAIAGIAGAHWPRKAKQAALSLSGVEAEEPSQNTALLEDSREAFGDKDETTSEAQSSFSLRCMTGLGGMQSWQGPHSKLAREKTKTVWHLQRIGPKRDRAGKAQGLAAQGLEAAKRGGPCR